MDKFGLTGNPFNPNAINVSASMLPQRPTLTAAMPPAGPRPQTLMEALKSPDRTPTTFGPVAQAVQATQNQQPNYGSMIGQLLGVGGMGSSYGVNAMKNIGEDLWR